jgi:thioredoxin reductase (NADPH)
MIDTDAVVIGAGPVGLFQVFQLGLLGIQAEIIDVLPEPGGQCMALYPDKPIYDIPGVPVCTGRELTQRLLQQAAPFLPPGPDGRPGSIHLGQLASSLQAMPQGGFRLDTEQGLSFTAKAVFIAAGAGAFVPKTLNVPELQGTENLHYRLSDAPAWAGQHLVVAGGGDEALSSILDIVQSPTSSRPARLTLLHRRAQFQAEEPLIKAVQALIDGGEIELAVGLPNGAQVQAGRIVNLSLLDAQSATVSLPLDHLLVRQGMSPKLGPITQWGLALERKQLSVQNNSFETSVPGIYAVGDINTYPGKKRLLLCGFHEATLAAHHAAALLHPDAPQHLLYTTTSALLHERLGVKR